jgi:hypothetical protein
MIPIFPYQTTITTPLHLIKITTTTPPPRHIEPPCRHIINNHNTQLFSIKIHKETNKTTFSRYPNTNPNSIQFPVFLFKKKQNLGTSNLFSNQTNIWKIPYTINWKKLKLIGKKIETPDRDYFSFVFLVLTVSLLEKTRVIKDLTGDIERRRQNQR